MHFLWQSSQHANVREDKDRKCKPDNYTFYPTGGFACYPSQTMFFWVWNNYSKMCNCGKTEPGKTHATVMSLSGQNHSSCVYGLLVNRYYCGSHCHIPETCFHAAAHHFFVDVASLLRVLKHSATSSGVKIQLSYTLPASLFLLSAACLFYIFTPQPPPFNSPSPPMGPLRVGK